MNPDFDQILEWVRPHSRVLDLGCGEGELLATLERHKHVRGYGLEIDEAKITACMGKGVNVIEQNIDDGLSNIDDDAFDVVVMTHALQALQHPDQALDEMLRIARECIITFPNFAYWRHRVHLGLKGRMPVSKSLPHAWFDTPNIHLSTFKDFDQLCQDKGYTIVDQAVGRSGEYGNWLTRLMPNLFSQMAIFRVQR